MSRNPWLRKHQNDERVFSDHLPASVTNRMVEREFEIGESQQRPCDCGEGEQRWYRATVGAFICPSCRSLERFDGSVVR